MNGISIGSFLEIEYLWTEEEALNVEAGYAKFHLRHDWRSFYSARVTLPSSEIAIRVAR